MGCTPWCGPFSASGGPPTGAAGQVFQRLGAVAVDFVAGLVSAHGVKHSVGNIVRVPFVATVGCREEGDHVGTDVARGGGYVAERCCIVYRPSSSAASSTSAQHALRATLASSL